MDREQFLGVWIVALESGEYEQCYEFGYGDDRTGYCAIGVASKALRPDKMAKGEWLIDKGLITEEQYAMVCKWNDTDKLTFKEIAKNVKEWKNAI